MFCYIEIKFEKQCSKYEVKSQAVPQTPPNGHCLSSCPPHPVFYSPLASLHPAGHTHAPTAEEAGTPV